MCTSNSLTSPELTAIQLDSEGFSKVTLMNYNGSMAVCAAHGEGPVLITRELAMEFFNLIPKHD